ncbi:MAG: glycosyltransferase [Clostridia bacterium]|nr:glycosyltransferase [Clostridia bacterium]
MKKVLIFYASYGGGHLSAARSIKEYIDSNFPNIDSELIDCVKYINKAFNSVTTKAYSEMAKKVPMLWGRVYKRSESGPLATISNTSNKVMAIKLNKLLKEKQPDLIICTHPFGSQMCSYLKKKGKLDCKIATVMTDYAPHNQWLVGHKYIDYFFVSHDGMKSALLKKGIDNSKVYATGIPLSNKFLLKYNKSEILNGFGLDANKKTVLFFGGGEFGLGKSKTLDIFKSLVLNDNNIQVVAVAGKNQKMKANFENVVEQNNKEHSVRILEYTDKVPQLMSISDLVVTKPGGLTTTESLASGLPIVIINPIPGQEEENAEFLEKNKVAIWIRKNDNVESILNDLFSNPNKMREMKIRARIMAKRNSTKDICNILLGDESVTGT